MTPDLAQVLADAVARGDPTLYLDTNVLLDLIRPRRRPASSQLVSECLQRSWTCTSSTFALMEALDIEQTNRWASTEMRKGQAFDQLWRGRGERVLAPRVLNSIYKQFVEALDERVELFQPDESAWEDAIQLAIDTATFAPDCVHVAAALSRRCDVLVTWDQQLRRAAARQMELATPDEVLPRVRAASAQERASP